MKNLKSDMAKSGSQHALLARELQERLSLNIEAMSRLVAVIKAVDDSRFGNQETDTVSLVSLALELGSSLGKEINQIESIANSLSIDMSTAHDPNSQSDGKDRGPGSIDVALLTLNDWADRLASVAQLMDEIKGELSENSEFQKVDHLFNGAVALIDDVQVSVLEYEPHKLLQSLKIAS